MKPLVLALDDPSGFASVVAAEAGGEIGQVETRRFPDGESYVRLDAAPAGRDVAIVAALDRPDPKLPALLFLAATARDLGARRGALAAPYLPYMRQDIAFRPGESVSARTLTGLLSRAFDGVATIDPHLHRIARLSDVFAGPAVAAEAAPAIAAWIGTNVEAPLVVGPDSESRQWASRIAALAGCPFAVLEKRRSGDREVAVSGEGLAGLSGRTPVLVDDIISTAGTMIAAAARIVEAGGRAPVCVGVHGLFAGDAYARLAAVASAVVTTNAVAHPSNVIDVRPALARGVAELLAAPPG